MCSFFVYRDDEKLSGMEKDGYESIFTCRWEVQSVSRMKENQETIKMNVPFQHSEKKLFLVELEMKKNLEKSSQHTLNALKFLSFGHHSISCEMEDVACFFQDKDNSTHQITMNEQETYDEDLL